MRILSSVDKARFDRLVSELVADGEDRKRAESLARVQIGRDRAAVAARVKALGGDWSERILTRRAC